MKIFVLMCAVFLGSLLEKVERENSNLLWGSVLCVSLFFISIPAQRDSITKESIRPEILIRGGKGNIPRESFNSPNMPPTSGGNDGRPTITPPITPQPPFDYPEQHRYPWDTGSSSGGSIPGKGDLDNNKIPSKSEWEEDQMCWDDFQQEDEKKSKETEKSGKLGVPVDFEYTTDINGNPTLLVPTPDEVRARTHTKVDYDQTASHVHHIGVFNIPLPADFDMAYYMKLNRLDRINYAKNKLPKETLIQYQNEIGKSMSPKFTEFTTMKRPIPGFAGKRKYPTELTLEGKRNNNVNDNVVSIIREDGKHISSYIFSREQLMKLKDDNFWVLKDRDL